MENSFFIHRKEYYYHCISQGSVSFAVIDDSDCTVAVLMTGAGGVVYLSNLPTVLVYYMFKYDNN